MRKKFILTMTIVMMLSIVLASTAFAGSASRSGSIEGYSCYGYVNCSSSGGFASTSFGTSGQLEVRLIYTYIDNNEEAQIIVRESGSGSSTLVTALTPRPEGRSRDSMGYFEVTYIDSQWFAYATAYY